MNKYISINNKSNWFKYKLMNFINNWNVFIYFYVWYEKKIAKKFKIINCKFLEIKQF